MFCHFLVIINIYNKGEVGKNMKHHPKVVAVLLGLFLLSQFLGLAILQMYIDPVRSVSEGKVVFKELPIGERPLLEEDTSYVPMMIAVLAGTAILLLLIKFQLHWVWRIWFLLAVIISLSIAFGAFLWTGMAISLAVVLGVWKIFKPNFYVHTFTELFSYGGLAVIFVPLLNIWSVSVLLVLIGLYDAYAVWKSKHMVTLAKSQTQAKVFAGLLLPYEDGKIKTKTQGSGIHHDELQRKKVPVKIRTAMLGGGDIGFPLIFAGVVLKEMGVWQALVIPFFALAGLGFLLWYGDEHRFYPAMPFIGAGCFLGLGVVWGLQILLG